MIVTDNVVINDGAILEIAEGTVIQFNGYFSIEVNGSIIAEGNPDERIIFTSEYPEEFDLDESQRGCWHGIRFSNISALEESSSFEYCVFEYSKSVGNAMDAGGAISCLNYSKLKIENCIFRNNLAERGGAIALRKFSNPQIVNNLFHHNYALEIASVLYNEYSYPLLVNNTMADNESLNEDMWIVSSTISNFFGKPKLSNNIIWFNITEYFMEFEIFEPRLYYCGMNQINQELNYYNIYTEPELFDDYSLMGDNTSIDLGELVYEDIIPQTDLAGNSRIDGENIDIGCYEYIRFDADENSITEAAAHLNVFPNPFNPEVKVSFSSSERGMAQFEVYDIKGRMVYHTDKYIDKGDNCFSWNGKLNGGEAAGSGVYFFKVTSPEFEIIEKGCLLK